ncbi:alpha/beta hydrolase, partial [Mycolicibacterium sp.]
MTEAPPAQQLSMHSMNSIDGSLVPVKLSGPVTGRRVVLFGDPTGEDHEPLCARLHVAMFRTVVLPADRGLTPKSIVGILDQLGVVGGVLVSTGAGARLAWSLAATHGEHFTGLVTVGSGHPAVPDARGRTHDEHCPTVEVDT